MNETVDLFALVFETADGTDELQPVVYLGGWGTVCEYLRDLRRNGVIAEHTRIVNVAGADVLAW